MSIYRWISVMCLFRVLYWAWCLSQDSYVIILIPVFLPVYLDCPSPLPWASTSFTLLKLPFQILSDYLPNLAFLRPHRTLDFSASLTAGLCSLWLLSSPPASLLSVCVFSACLSRILQGSILCSACPVWAIPPTPPLASFTYLLVPVFFTRLISSCQQAAL